LGNFDFEAVAAKSSGEEINLLLWMSLSDKSVGKAGVGWGVKVSVLAFGLVSHAGSEELKFTSGIGLCRFGQ